MGVTVNETISETTTAADKVTANSLNKRPTMPPINKMGKKTAIKDKLIAVTVKPTSFVPTKAALKGGMPFSICRLMFSNTTMASSTTKPVEMVNAIRVRLLIL